MHVKQHSLKDIFYTCCSSSSPPFTLKPLPIWLLAPSPIETSSVKFTNDLHVMLIFLCFSYAQHLSSLPLLLIFISSKVISLSPMILNTVYMPTISKCDRRRNVCNVVQEKSSLHDSAQCDLSFANSHT